MADYVCVTSVYCKGQMFSPGQTVHDLDEATALHLGESITQLILPTEADEDEAPASTQRKGKRKTELEALESGQS
jgi:hypothetical protein